MKLVKKIDIHTHVRSISDGAENKKCNAEELLEIYDRVGIEKAVICPLVQTERQYISDRNQEAMEVVEKYPDRFAWFCGIDPRQDEETDFSTILNRYKAQGAKGIGEFIPRVFFDDPIAWEFFYHAELCDMPVIFHIGDEKATYGLMDEFGLPHLEKTLQQFPKLKFLGHSEPWWAHLSGDVTPEQYVSYPQGKVMPGGRVVELMRKYPNLCGDLSAGSGCNALTRDPEFAYDFLEEFQERLFFGTDITSPSGGVAKKLADFLDNAVTEGKISYDAYYKISRGNAEKLLG